MVKNGESYLVHKDCLWWNEVHKYSDIMASTYSIHLRHIISWYNSPARPVALWGCEGLEEVLQGWFKAADSTACSNRRDPQPQQSQSSNKQSSNKQTSNKDSKTYGPSFLWRMCFILCVVFFLCLLVHLDTRRPMMTAFCLPSDATAMVTYSNLPTLQPNQISLSATKLLCTWARLVVDRMS